MGPRKPNGCTINYASTSVSTTQASLHSRRCGCSYGRSCDCGANPCSLRFRTQTKPPCNHCRNCLRNLSSTGSGNRKGKGKAKRRRKLRCLQHHAPIKSTTNLFTFPLPLHTDQGPSSVKVHLHPGEIHPKALAALSNGATPLLDQLTGASPTPSLVLPRINFVLLHLHRVACAKRVRQLKALNAQDVKACEETRQELKQLQLQVDLDSKSSTVREIYVDTRMIHDTWQRVKLAEACAMAQTKLAHVEGVMGKRTREIRALEARIGERAALRLQVVFRNMQMKKEDINVASNGSMVSAAVERGEKALVMQRTFRCYRARTTVKALKTTKRGEEAHEAVREIQRVRRGQVGRRRAKRRAMELESERKDSAAKVLQRYWRMVNTRAKERDDQLEMIAVEWAGRIAGAATTIQRFGRGWLSRRRRMDRRRQLKLGPRVKHLCQRYIAKGDLSGFIHAVNAEFEQHRSQVQQIKAQEVDNAQTFIKTVLEHRQHEVDHNWKQWLLVKQENPSLSNDVHKRRMKTQTTQLSPRQLPWYDALAAKRRELRPECNQPRLFDPYRTKKNATARVSKLCDLRQVSRQGPKRLKSLAKAPVMHKVFAVEDEQVVALPRPNPALFRPAVMFPGAKGINMNESALRTGATQLTELAFNGIETFSMLEAEATLLEPFEALFRNAYMRKAMEELGAKTVSTMVDAWLALTPSNQDAVRAQVANRLAATHQTLNDHGVTTCADVAELTEEELTAHGVPSSACKYIRTVLQAAKQRASSSFTTEDVQVTWQEMKEAEQAAAAAEESQDVAGEGRSDGTTLEDMVKQQAALEEDLSGFTNKQVEGEVERTGTEAEEIIKGCVGLADEIEEFVIQVVFDRLEHYHDLLLPIKYFLRLIRPLPKSLQRKLLLKRLKLAHATANPYVNMLQDAGFHRVHTLATSSLHTVHLPTIAKRDILEAFAEMNGVDLQKPAQLPPLNTKGYAKSITDNGEEKPYAVAGSRKTQLLRRMKHQAVEAGKRFELGSTSVDGMDTVNMDYVAWRNMDKVGVEIDVVSPEELGKLEQWGLI